jgi:hypothetical protein
MADRPPRLLKFLSAEVELSSDDRCHARVKLLHQNGATHVGEAEGSCEAAAQLRLAAQAAADCVCQAVGGQGDKLEVTGAVTTEAFGKRTVFVQVTATYLGQRRELLGFCVISADPVRAAAVAVLNALNRFLGIG